MVSFTLRWVGQFFFYLALCHLFFSIVGEQIIQQGCHKKSGKVWQMVAQFFKILPKFNFDTSYIGRPIYFYFYSISSAKKTFKSNLFFFQTLSLFFNSSKTKNNNTEIVFSKSKLRVWQHWPKIQACLHSTCSITHDLHSYTLPDDQPMGAQEMKIRGVHW